MSKLNEIRDEVAKNTFPSEGEDSNYVDMGLVGQADFCMGWDAAMALNLPVKFGRWLSQEYNPLDGINYWHNHENEEEKTTEELFDYFIENVFKPE